MRLTNWGRRVMCLKDVWGLWRPVCICGSGNLKRITHGTTRCLDCGQETSPIEAYGFVRCPLGCLLIQKGMEVPFTPRSSRLRQPKPFLPSPLPVNKN